MLLWLIMTSIVFLVVPIVLMLVWVSNDERGAVILEPRAKNLNTLVVLVIICYAIAAGIIVYNIIQYTEEGYDGFVKLPALIIWILLALISIIYPVSVFKNARMEGKKLNMWEHLSTRKEIIFPWEYNPVAINVAAVYFICSLIILVITLYFILFYTQIFLNPVLDWVVTVGVLLIGGFICYLMLKPDKA